MLYSIGMCSRYWVTDAPHSRTPFQSNVLYKLVVASQRLLPRPRCVPIWSEMQTSGRRSLIRCCKTGIARYIANDRGKTLRSSGGSNR